MKNDQKFSGLLLLKILGRCGRKDERKLLEVYHLMVLLSLTERTAIEVVIFLQYCADSLAKLDCIGGILNSMKNQPSGSFCYACSMLFIS